MTNFESYVAYAIIAIALLAILYFDYVWGRGKIVVHTKKHKKIKKLRIRR